MLSFKISYSSGQNDYKVRFIPQAGKIMTINKMLSQSV